MAIHSDTRTIHTIFIPLPDDVLGKIEDGDEVEIQLQSRSLGRSPSPIRVSYSNVRRLLRDDA